MADIRHRIAVKAPREQVYNALATIEGLAGWWTRDTRGEAAPGKNIAFYFGGENPAAVMTVTEQGPNRVAWRCDEGPEEWLGTTVTFDLKREDEYTVVLFTHAGWQEPVEFMHHCSSRWAYFLFSLKAGIERGAATPWPDDEPIDNWG